MASTFKSLGTATLCIVVAGTASAFKITWTGAADGVDAFNEGNWLLATTQAAPPAGTVDPGQPINLIIELDQDASAADASAGPFTIGASGLLQVGGGSFTSTNVIRRDATPNVNDQSNASLNISNAPQSIGRVTASAVYEINVALINELTLTDGEDPLRFSSVGFSASPTAGAVLTLTNESVDDVVAEHLAKFTIAGAAAVIGSDPSIPEPGDNLRIVSDGLLGSIVTPVTVPITPGDTDGDGDIDDTDLGTAFSNYTGPTGSGKTHPQGDTDGDGDIDDSDLGTLFSAYTGPQAPPAVPEPASAVIFGLTLLGMVTRRR
ncbi:MAG: PEP-CTERM sorting domain-containing protein [Phycisphaeraceae bacterium]